MLKERPFVHVYKACDMFFLYDVNTSAIRKISRETYDILRMVEHGGEIENTALTNHISNEIDELLKEGLLKPFKDFELKHPATDNYQYAIHDNIKQLTLQVTQNCNFRCKYCVYSGSYMNRHHSNKRMDFQTAKKAIDFYMKHCTNISMAMICFYGGEPLLEFDLIKKCVKYCKDNYGWKKLWFGITTNASLLNNTIIRFFKDEFSFITVSIDGPEHIQNKNRVFTGTNDGTYSCVINKIHSLLEELKDTDIVVGFNSVLDEDTNFIDTDRFFCDSMFNGQQLSFSAVTDTMGGKRFAPSDEFVSNSGYALFLSYLALLGRVGIDNYSKIHQESIHVLRKKVHNRYQSSDVIGSFNHPGGPCVPGVARLFCNVDGDFFPCERVSENSPIMKIGNVDDGIDVKKGENLLNVGRITEDKCKKCWAFSFCTSCATHCDGVDCLSSEKRLSKCSEVKTNAEYNLITYSILSSLGFDFDNEMI